MSLSPQQRFWIAAGILLLVGLLTLFFYQSSTSYRWDENYQAGRKDPYSTHVIARLLEDRAGADAFHILTDSLTLPKAKPTSANYVFIGEGLWLDSLEIDRLLAFIRQGNTAFVSSLTLPEGFVNAVAEARACPPWNDYPGLTDTLMIVGLYEPAWTVQDDILLQFRYRDDFRPYRWRYIDPFTGCAKDDEVALLGYMGTDMPNFVRLPLGEGRLILHSTPLAFSNLTLLDEEAVAYAERAFSHLAEGPIYWDEWTKVTESVARSRNSEAFSPPERRLSDQSPLQYILRQPALSWAWYMLLALGLLHLLFKTRRRQRIQPLPRANTNTSLEFLDTISRLYFLQKDHRKLALLQTRLFRAWVHQHYDLPGHQFDEAFVEELAARAKWPREKLRELLEQFRQIEGARQIKEKTLMAYHRKLEALYRLRTS